LKNLATKWSVTGEAKNIKEGGLGWLPGAKPGDSRATVGSVRSVPPQSNGRWGQNPIVTRVSKARRKKDTFLRNLYQRTGEMTCPKNK
jgi:hypothetical protein